MEKMEEKEILAIIENHLQFNVRKVENWHLLFIQPKTKGGWSIKTFIDEKEYKILKQYLIAKGEKNYE